MEPQNFWPVQLRQIIQATSIRLGSSITIAIALTLHLFELEASDIKFNRSFFESGIRDGRNCWIVDKLTLASSRRAIPSVVPN